MLASAPGLSAKILNCASSADLDIDDCGAFIGTKSQGGVLGEHSLISADSVHAYTAKAGETGADLLCIDRATFWHFADLGRTGVSEIPAQVASALRVACCQSILEMAPPDRSESDVQLLVEFLRGLQVCFQILECDAEASDASLVQSMV